MRKSKQWGVLWKHRNAAAVGLENISLLFWKLRHSFQEGETTFMLWSIPYHNDDLLKLVLFVLCLCIVYMCTGTCAYSFMGVSFFITLCPITLRQGLLLNLFLLGQWPASSQDPPVSTCRTGAPDAHGQGFWGSEIRHLMFAHQVFFPSWATSRVLIIVI